MPHIHTEDGQRDVTVSALIVREEKGELFCLVHMHRKIDLLMQIGGHIELDQTPWQAIAEELVEETGYALADLTVLQPAGKKLELKEAAVHPVPISMNTHYVGDGHYHSDLCYGFVAKDKPTGQPKEGQSMDLRWCTLTELKKYAAEGVALQDCCDIYAHLVTVLPNLQQVSTDQFPLTKPKIGIKYKR